MKNKKGEKMKNYDVIIIGGGPSGIIAGVTGKKQNVDKSFLMIKEEAKGLIPCGIPYIFHDLNDVSKDAMGPKPFIDAGGDVLIDKVINIDITEKTLKTQNNDEFKYEKLVFATGSTPTIPTFIKGNDLEGVEFIKKSYDYIEKLKNETDEAKNIVIVGGGFIGVEVAEQLSKFKDKNISLVEMEEFCLYRAFSKDIAKKVDEILQNTEINLLTNNKIEEIIGKNGKVTKVKLVNGKEIDADLVIFSIGYKPNTELAKKSGLEITSQGTIRCDNYLRTNKKDIYAIGDCSQTIGFITGRTDNIMLASTATSESRILGYNLFEINLIRNFIGTLSVFSTEIGGTTFASVGAIEQEAKAHNINYIIGKFEDVDRHPGTIKDANKLMIKLIVSPKTGKIIGGELYGGKSAGEIINILSLAIQKETTVYELTSLQFGTHPLLTTAPTKYVLIKAAEMAILNIKKKNYKLNQ
ncbi:MAG: FAD-dependent oxidoreductase [Candidatus Marinimicrobia bacterium]|nr:FAD-dependent oxidoreductase [Candidatus Neomarinimicrobiota bacterium]